MIRSGEKMKKEVSKLQSYFDLIQRRDGETEKEGGMLKTITTVVSCAIKTSFIVEYR